jgi:Xaa-Pro aminopeptidase
MQSDIDSLMKESGIDALLVRGASRANPSMVYFTDSANITSATLLKKRGETPALIHFAMERDEAAKSGCQLKCIDDYGWLTIIEDAGGNMIQAKSELLKRIFADFGVRGEVAIYGRLEIGDAIAVARHLESLVPDVHLVGESIRDSVLARARKTKDTKEVDRIRRMGRITTSVVSEVADFLTSQTLKDGMLLDGEGQPVTIGTVRHLINVSLARLGAENPDDTIFSMGHDAAVPHDVGRDSDVLREGQAIIFDIFPCEAGGGYYYDFTRTWCLGYAPDAVLELYQDVLGVHQSLLKALRAGRACREFQEMACDLFEAKGHPTVRSAPNSEDGYVHSLGHGLGLDVHEAPSFSGLKSNDDLLEPGSIITLEPGLYYPGRDIGVRLEDTLWMRPDGRPEILAEYPLDLILPVKGV